MSDCERLSDRMPDVALQRAAWTAEEAGPPRELCRLPRRVGSGARCASTGGERAERATRPPSPPPSSAAWRPSAWPTGEVAGAGCSAAPPPLPPPRSWWLGGPSRRQATAPAVAVTADASGPAARARRPGHCPARHPAPGAGRPACRHVGARLHDGGRRRGCRARADLRHLGGLMRVSGFRLLLVAGPAAPLLAQQPDSPPGGPALRERIERGSPSGSRRSWTCPTSRPPSSRKWRRRTGPAAGTCGVASERSTPRSTSSWTPGKTADPDSVAH